MHDNKQADPASTSADDQPAGVPDWLVEAYPDSTLSTLDPEWYDPAQLDLTEALGHKWWQDEQAIVEPVIQPLPESSRVLPAPVAEDLQEGDGSALEISAGTTAELASDDAPNRTRATGGPDHIDLLPGETPRVGEAAEVSTPTVDASPDDADRTSENEESVRNAETQGRPSLLRSLKGRSFPRKGKSKGVAVPEEEGLESDEAPVGSGQDSRPSKLANVLSKIRGRSKTESETGESEESLGSAEASDKTSRRSLKIAWPAAMTLAEGPKDDPYRPRFAVAPSSTRAACVLLWTLAAANVVAAATFVTLALSSPGSLSLPTLGSLPVAALWLGVLFFSVTAVASILAGQGISRGYRTWFLVGVTAAVCTVWMPLLAVPALLLLLSRSTRDWVI